MALQPGHGHCTPMNPATTNLVSCAVVHILTRSSRPVLWCWLAVLRVHVFVAGCLSVVCACRSMLVGCWQLTRRRA